MRRWLCLAPLAACGCSTTPLADTYDLLYPIPATKAPVADAPLLPAFPVPPPAVPPATVPVDPNAPPPPKW